MSDTNVISVDPGAKTLGELRVGENRLSRISRRLSGPGKKVTAPFRYTLNLLFGINRCVNTRFSGKMMLLRLICGGLFIVMTLVPMSIPGIMAANFTTDAIVLTAVGISIILGLFSRMTTLAGAVWFGILFSISLEKYEPDMTCAAIMMVMAIFSVLGPGLYSMDRYIRRLILCLIRAGKKKTARCKKGGIQYNAYGSVDRRVS